MGGGVGKGKGNCSPILYAMQELLQTPPPAFSTLTCENSSTREPRDCSRGSSLSSSCHDDWVGGHSRKKKSGEYESNSS